MQVNVFITKQSDSRHQLLVLPMSWQAAIPERYRTGWTYYATVDTRDRMFGDVDAVTIEAQLARMGFALLTPEAPDRR